MGSRADRRARRVAKIAAFKEAFTQGLIANPDIDPDIGQDMAIGQDSAIGLPSKWHGASMLPWITWD